MWVCFQVVSKVASSVLGGAMETQGCCYNVAAGYLLSLLHTLISTQRKKKNGRGNWDRGMMRRMTGGLQWGSPDGRYSTVHTLEDTPLKHRWSSCSEILCYRYCYCSETIQLVSFDIHKYSLFQSHTSKQDELWSYDINPLTPNFPHLIFPLKSFKLKKLFYEMIC